MNCAHCGSPSVSSRKMVLTLDLSGSLEETDESDSYSTKQDPILNTEDDERDEEEEFETEEDIGFEISITVYRCSRCRKIFFEGDVFEYLEDSLLEEVGKFILENEEQALLKKPPFGKDFVWLITGED